MVDTLRKIQALALTASLALGGVACAGSGAIDDAGHGSGHEADPLASMRPGLVPASVPADYVVTPHGFFHPSCIVHVHADETIDGDFIKKRNGSSRAVTKCKYPRFDARGRLVASSGPVLPHAARDPGTGNDPPPPGADLNGWAVAADTTAIGAVSQLSATWVVPPAPTNAGTQIVYFFPGTETLNGDQNMTILQPVLGWYGGTWTIASWNCCRDGNPLHSDPIVVKEGDTIVGSQVGGGCDPATGVCSSWQIVTANATTGEQTVLDTTSYQDPEDWVFAGVLEAYGISTCDQLPPDGSITFGGLSVTTVDGGTPSVAWDIQVMTASNDCHYGGADGGSAIALTYGGGGGGGCDYACVDYGYAEGQCFQGWQCEGGCLVANGCSDGGPVCDYACSDYGFSEGQCYQGWDCAGGCLYEDGCSDGSCQFACGDYGYAEGQCYQAWQCEGGCLYENGCT